MAVKGAFSNENVLFYESDNTGKISKSSRHSHPWLEIYYLESGACRCLIEDTLYILKPGDLMLIPPGLIHQSSYHVPDHSRMLVSCSQHYYPDFVSSLTTGGNYVFRNSRITGEILAIFKNIEQEWNRWDPYSIELITGSLYRCFALLGRSPNHYTNESVGNPHVEAMLSQINLHYDTDITLERFARELSVSREHLSRIFKKETGLCFHDYLTSVRIKHAEQLLQQNKEKTITEIAFSCGFNDSNYFSHKFKMVSGISPLQYQRNFGSSQ